MEDEARELNIGFVSRMTRGRPWVRLKIAATLDGRTALAERASRNGSPAPEARRDGHRWRARACAVLTGVGTVRADDPRLTVREVETPRQPLRVVVDSRLETPPRRAHLRARRCWCLRRRPGELPNAEVVALPNQTGKVDLPKMLRGAGAPRRERAARRGGLPPERLAGARRLRRRVPGLPQPELPRRRARRACSTCRASLRSKSGRS